MTALAKRSPRSLIAPRTGTAARGKVDQLEAALARHPQIKLQVTHRFTPGLYIREIVMPAGAIVTSKVHKKEHPYVISKGSCSVYTEGEGWQLIRAPFTGITKPGTHRAIRIHAETVWTTFHVTNETDLAKIEAEMIEPHAAPSPLECDNKFLQ